MFFHQRLEKIAAQRRIEAAEKMRNSYALEEEKKAKRSVQVITVPVVDARGKGGRYRDLRCGAKGVLICLMP